MGFQGVLFDMDGLLLDTEKQYLGTFIATCAKFGLRDKEKVFYDCIGLRLADSTKVLEKGLGGLVDLGAFLTTWDETIIAERAAHIPVKPMAPVLLQALKERDILCAVATSTGTEKAKHHLEQTGLLPYVHTVIGGDQVENGKPAPDIYLKAAEALGVAAAACVAFEDSDPGTLAAIRSGAKVVQVPDLKQPSPKIRAMGHIIAKDLMEGARTVGLL